MADQGTDTRQHSFDPIFPADMMLQALRVWQMPFVLGAAWWSNLMPGWSAQPLSGHHAVHHDPHAQLVVPEPLEETGENLVA